MIELSNVHNLLVDALIMVCADLNAISDSDVEDYLRELEGDYYTFFDMSNLLPLQEGGMLTRDQIDNIAALKIVINKIPVALWNKDAFRNDSHWEEARKLSNSILNSLGVSKRQI
ncbi:hypothetical protein ACTJKN_02415 [Pedobacter sp. 22163]|uniref:hypothetical protein n=1 Tax=Pedobacter sp. 22163 TaxID=3453883 RepID=UPI003F8703B4